MEDIMIIGAGGFGREVQWLIERINLLSDAKQWNLLGFIDDGLKQGTCINGLEVLGGVEFLLQYDKEINVVCAVGNVNTRKKIVDAIKENSNIKYPNLIDPSVVCSERIALGQGNIICANNTLTVDIKIKDFCILNLDCTVGHDTIIDDYVTVYPSVNISGCVEVGTRCELGTGTQIIQGCKICENTILGAGSVVIKDISKSGTYVGCPAKLVLK